MLNPPAIDWLPLFRVAEIPEEQRPLILHPLPPQQLSASGRYVIEATRDASVIRFALRAIELKKHTAGLARHLRVLASEPFDPWPWRPKGNTPSPFASPYHLIWREVTQQLPEGYLGELERQGLVTLGHMFEDLRDRLERRLDLLPLLKQMRRRGSPMSSNRFQNLLYALRLHRDKGFCPKRLRIGDLGLAMRRGKLMPVLAHPGPSFRTPLHRPERIFVMPDTGYRFSNRRG